MSWKNHIQFLLCKIASGYDCRGLLKYVSKAYNILCVKHKSHKQVVGLIYMKQLCVLDLPQAYHMRQSCTMLISLNKVAKFWSCRHRRGTSAKKSLATSFHLQLHIVIQASSLSTWSLWHFMWQPGNKVTSEVIEGHDQYSTQLLKAGSQQGV